MILGNHLGVGGRKPSFKREWIPSLDGTKGKINFIRLFSMMFKFKMTVILRKFIKENTLPVVDRHPSRDQRKKQNQVFLRLRN